MKWVIALNEPCEGFEKHSKKYEQFAKIAVYSAKINAPNLEPILIYNGRPNYFTSEMKSLGAQVIHHQLSFENVVMNADERDDHWKQTAKGAFLRLDIPEIIESDETILYSDTDVIFLKDPSNYNLRTNLIALSTEFDINDFNKVNTGTMLINLREARKIFPLVIKQTIQNINIIPDYDQGAIQIFLNQQWDRLHQYMNWKPYWGINENSIIVHFHGPKPSDFDIENEKLLNEAPIYKSLLNLSPLAYSHYLKKWCGLFHSYNFNLKINDR